MSTTWLDDLMGKADEPITMGKAFRKGFMVHSVQVTEKEIGAISRFCGGTIYKDSERQYIGLSLPRGMYTKAYVGDWIVVREGRFSVYNEKSYRSTFETHEEKVLREQLYYPETKARNEMILALVERAMLKQDVATHLQTRDDMNAVAKETTEQIIRLFS